jgi:hypothetical protein
LQREAQEQKGAGEIGAKALNRALEIEHSEYFQQLPSSVPRELKVELPSYSFRKPLADEGLVRNRFHGGNLAERLNLDRIEFDGDILKPAGSLADEYLAAQLCIQRELNWAALKFPEHAMVLVVFGSVFLYSCRAL